VIRPAWDNEIEIMAMNEQVGYALIDAEVRRLRKLPYLELASLVGKTETKQVVGEDDKTYQLQIDAVWDSKKGENVRLIVAADDGGWRAFKPLTGDFIMRPDGTLVGESLNGPTKFR
jgi:hypothetical protein